MEVSVNQRIRTVLQNNNLSITAFCKELSLPQTTINKQINGDSKLSFDTIKAFLTRFPDISADWLINGNGEMLSTAATATEPAMIPTDDGSGIPLITAEAMAGTLVGETFVYPHECPRFVVPSFDKPSFLIPVCGDSMEPMFHTGDLVACRIVPLSSIFFQWGKPYVINTQQGALIKRVQPGDTDDTITLVSDNERYLPFSIPKSEIYQIAIVVGLIRPL